MKIIWLDLAVQDLSAVETYIAKDKPSAAIKVVLRIIEAVEILLDSPGIGRPGRIEGTKELVVSGTPYIVPYRVKEDIIEILRILHGAMKWPDKI